MALIFMNFGLSLLAIKYIHNYQVLYGRLFANTQEIMGKSAKQLVLGESKGFSFRDSRIETLEKFLAKYNSDLYPYAARIVEVSDKHQFHYGLLPAIAMVESGLCRKIPADSYNCWGWGIYGKKVTRFASYDEAIEVVAAGIKRDYIDKGLVSLEQIMTKYNPANHNNWLGSVSFFFSTLD